jgi:NAD(P)-dependent dehydrogenase (short-subunit alcohol dehydrogenase family)
MSPPPPDWDIFSPRMMWWSARNPPDDPITSFEGKTILITGANVGLGFESAVKFATLKAECLIFGVRSLERGEAAKTQLCERTSYDAENVKLYEIDQCSFASVEKFAKKVSEMEERIDVVVLNAGGVLPKHTLTADGWEFELQVMVLSTALLAILLMPKLRESAKLSGQPSHLEFVGSSGHHGVKISDFDPSPGNSILDQVSAESYYDLQRQYCVVKLFVMYVMAGLIEDLGFDKEDTGNEVIISTTCTALCRTNLGREFGWGAKAFNTVFQSIFARTAEQGSRSIVSGVTLGKEAMGEFWSYDVFFRYSPLPSCIRSKTHQ